MALIELKDVTIAFEGVAAVERVNLAVERGEYLVIVGENGSGKSTLVRAMLGLVRPKSGRVVYGDGLKKNPVSYTHLMDSSSGIPVRERTAPCSFPIFAAQSRPCATMPSGRRCSASICRTTRCV